MNNKNFLRKRLTIIGDFIYYFILIMLLIVVFRIVYQQIKYPDKIPDIFGWKIFMVLDKGYNNDSVSYGDLVFTQIIDTNKIDINDVIAFRNTINTVTVNKISNISKKYIIDEKTGEKKFIKTFEFKTDDNESENKKNTTEENVEGILRYRIPNVGLVLFNIQKPDVLAKIILVILIIGFVLLQIAKKIDERENKKKI